MYRQIVGIPVATICVPIVAGLFQVWYERDFMLSLSDKIQAYVVEVFNCALQYASLNIDDPEFEQMVSQIYPAELYFNNANSYGEGL